MKRREFTAYVDDMDIALYGMKLANYEIPSYAKRKTVGTDVPGAHGTQAVPSALSSGTFTANVVCVGSDADEVNTKIREFFAFMYSNMSSRRIVFSDDVGIVRNAILDSPDNYRVVTGVDCAFAELKLTFLMLDPFMYSNELTRYSETCGHGSKMKVVNQAFECPAVFKIENEGAAAVEGIALIVNNELATFSCVLEPGDVLELDTVEYEVRLNGIVHLEYWNGQMPKLKNGSNEVYQQNDSDADLKLTVAFTKRWI